MSTARIRVTVWLITEQIRNQIRKLAPMLGNTYIGLKHLPIIQKIPRHEMSGNRKLTCMLSTKYSTCKPLPICFHGWDCNKDPSPDMHKKKNVSTEQLLIWTKKNIIIRKMEKPKNIEVLCPGSDSGDRILSDSNRVLQKDNSIVGRPHGIPAGFTQKESRSVLE